MSSDPNEPTSYSEPHDDPSKGHRTTQVHAVGSMAKPDTLIAGKYQLLECIGEGGMGTVWKAEQREPVKRLVAIKLIKTGQDSKSVLARFEAERQALAIMDHPSIARILDGGVTAFGAPYFVMELVKGVPITEFCDSHRMTPTQRLELFIPVCQAIQHAHQKGIIHRDIKPSNVMVTVVDDKPVPKVIDFGVAKATGGSLTDKTVDTGFGVVGTPQYMSPEQASFQQLDVDTRSDIYSLGVLLYELLTGTPPFEKRQLEKAGYAEVLRIIREVDPPRPSTKLSSSDALPSLSANRGIEPSKLSILLRSELDWIVMKALEKDRTRRYETANGFAADIARYLAGEAVQAHPPSQAYRLKKILRQHRGPVVAALLVAASLVVGIIGTSYGFVTANQQRKLVENAKAATDASNEKLRESNDALEQSFRRETERFELARQAIGIFHGDISEDLLLKEARFKELRTRLLQGAATFYGRLENLLVQQSDPVSRRALGQAYFELGELTAQIGNKAEALGVYRKGLSVYRDLVKSSAPQNEDRVQVARGLSKIGGLQEDTGDVDGAKSSWNEAKSLLTELDVSDDLSEEALGGLATIHLQLGGFTTSTGNQLDAVGLYEKGIEILKKALAKDPSAVVLNRELAFAHNNIGVVCSKTGRREDALVQFKQALAIRNDLATRNPKQSTVQLDLAKAHIGIAEVQPLPDQQLESYGQAKQILVQLFTENPTSLEIKAALADIHGNIAYVYLNTGKLDEALADYRREAELLLELVADNPDVVDYRGNLARAYNNMGATLSRTDAKAALVEMRKAIDVQFEITERYPTIARYQSELAQSHTNFGWMQRYLGDFDGAVGEYKKAIALLDRLIEANPQVTQYRVSLAGNHMDIGVAMDRAGRLDKSMESLAVAIAIQEKLVKENPENYGFARELGRSLNNLADNYLSSENLPKALEAYQRSRELHDRIVKASPTVTDFRNGYGYTLSGLGRVLGKSGRNAEAVAAFREAIAQRLQMPSLSPGATYDMASNHATLALLCNEADSGLKPEDAESEIVRTMETLSKAVDIGFRDLKMLLEDSNFNSFRDRAEFKTIAERIEKVIEKP